MKGLLCLFSLKAVCILKDELINSDKYLNWQDCFIVSLLKSSVQSLNRVRLFATP